MDDCLDLAEEVVATTTTKTTFYDPDDCGLAGRRQKQRMDEIREWCNSGVIDSNGNIDADSNITVSSGNNMVKVTDFSEVGSMEDAEDDFPEPYMSDIIEKYLKDVKNI